MQPASEAPSANVRLRRTAGEDWLSFMSDPLTRAGAQSQCGIRMGDGWWYAGSAGGLAKCPRSTRCKIVPVHALQQPGAAFAHVGQLAFIAFVVFPRTRVIVPPHAAHSCFVPTGTKCGANFPLTFVGEYSVTMLVLHAVHAIADGVADSVVTVAFFTAFSVRMASICCQYCGPGPANAEFPRPIARARTEPSPNMPLRKRELFMVFRRNVDSCMLRVPP